MSYNQAENAILLNFDNEGGAYELHMLPKDARGGDTVVVPPPPPFPRHTH